HGTAPQARLLLLLRAPPLARSLPSFPSPLFPGLPCCAAAALHLAPPHPTYRLRASKPRGRRPVMGKYMRKSKVSGEVAVMEVPGGALLGVRTRSRTLAMQRAQRPPEKGDAEEAGEYLELRSRRLEKPPQTPHKEAVHATRRVAGRKAAAAAADEDDIEVSFGENVLDFDAMERQLNGMALASNSSLAVYQSVTTFECFRLVSCLGSLGLEWTSFLENAKHYFFIRVLLCSYACFDCRSTRETTPCSLIRNSETISTPGSTTKSKTSSSMTSRQRMEASVCRFIPSSLEMEEFFAAAEQQEQHAFREKYNFCPVNDCPLPGRYEWARLDC
ncbi:hypothetical protein EJB05_08100, partial [Eragrostis curvula]